MNEDEARERLRRLIDEGLIKTIGHAQRREKALDAYAQARVEAALADEWKLLDGPEFDYKKLTAEQENLYAYAFNTGSKQAWEQAKAEHKAARADTLGLLETLRERYGTPVSIGRRFFMSSTEIIIDGIGCTRDEARALLAGKGEKE